MELTQEETIRKDMFIKLVRSLSIRPKVRSFGNNSALQSGYNEGVAFVKGEILKSEVVSLLGSDYTAVKSTVDSLT